MYVTRKKYLETISNFIDTDLIKVLTGVRRCGKSVLLTQIEEKLLNEGISQDQIIKINFEDLQFISLRNYLDLYKFIVEKIKDKKKHYIFLDEIQHVKKFEELLASLRASYNCSIFVTGSNSTLLSGKLASLLVGRCIEFRIMPFTFKEAVEYLTLQNKSIDPYQFILDYVKWGGFPLRFNLSSESDISNYLNQVYRGILEKDIIQPNSKINKENFFKICDYLISNAGKEFSGKNIASFFKTVNNESIDPKTIYRYLEYMENACLISRVKKFNIAGKQVMTYTEKQYAVDTGLRMISTNFINFEDTFFLENIIYNELITRNYKVFVGKTYKGEVDFVVVKDQSKCFIQVCYYLNSPETINREFGAFKQISDASPKYVFSLDRFNYSRDGIAHHNIVDFLLEKVDITLT